MAQEVNISVRLADGMHVIGTNASGNQADFDSPTQGAGQGPSPMEQVLMSLAACSAMDVIAIMRKKRQTITAFEVSAHGIRTEEYPKPYAAIKLEFRFTGTGLDPAACERAIELSRDSYCPVWAMLRPTVDISYSYTITEA